MSRPGRLDRNGGMVLWFSCFPNAGQSMVPEMTAKPVEMRPEIPSARLNHGSARSLLLTLLGEYVIGSDEPVWTSTLITVLAGVGVAEKSARQAISRAAAAGWIEGDKSGRRAAWRLTTPGRQLIAEGSQRVQS